MAPRRQHCRRCDLRLARRAAFRRHAGGRGGHIGVASYRRGIWDSRNRHGTGRTGDHDVLGSRCDQRPTVAPKTARLRRAVRTVNGQPLYSAECFLPAVACRCRGPTLPASHPAGWHRTSVRRSRGGDRVRRCDAFSRSPAPRAVIQDKGKKMPARRPAHHGFRNTPLLGIGRRTALHSPRLPRFANCRRARALATKPKARGFTGTPVEPGNVLWRRLSGPNDEATDPCVGISESHVGILPSLHGT
jgi:hypothetical protein